MSVYFLLLNVWYYTTLWPLTSSVSNCQRGYQSRSKEFFFFFFRFLLLKIGQTATRVIRLTLEMPKTLTKALTNSWTWATKSFKIQPCISLLILFAFHLKGEWKELFSERNGRFAAAIFLKESRELKLFYWCFFLCCYSYRFCGTRLEEKNIGRKTWNGTFSIPIFCLSVADVFVCSLPSSFWGVEKS